MISTKIAAIIAIAAFAAGSVFSPPVQEAIAAVIATDVQCTGCVGSADIASSAVTTTKLAYNSVNGGKISDGTISAADLGPDSVGASEIKGITKLMFATCTPSFTSVAAGQVALITCSVPGVDSDDFVLVQNNHQGFCFDVQQSYPQTGKISLNVRNECTVSQNLAATEFGLIIWDK